MKKYNYFDDDDVIESKSGLGDLALAALDVFSKKLKGTKAEANAPKADTVSEEEKSSSDTLEPPKPSLQHAATAEPRQFEEEAAAVPGVESSEQRELIDAIKAFSHKSGDVIKTVTDAVRERAVAETVERISRGKKFFITLLLFVFTVVFFICLTAGLMHSINKENERIKDFNTKAGEVCSDYIIKYGNANYENLYDKYKVEGFRLTGLCFARELDFDNDGSSELMLCYNKNGEYYNEVWGDAGSGEFEVLFSEKTAQFEDKSQDAWATLYYKNNKYCIGVHDAEDISKVDMYQLKGGKFEKKFSCTYDVVTEAYSVDDKEDLISFERIKLSVLRVEKAIVSAEDTSNTIEGFLGVDNAGVQNNSPKTLEDAYYAVVQEYNKKYGVSQYVEKDGNAYVDGLAVVDLIDFDADGQNELLLVYRKEIKVRDEGSDGEHSTKSVDTYYADVYRYTGTRAVIAYTNEGISNTLNDSSDLYYILKKHDKVTDYCANSFSTENYGREVHASTSALEFDGEKFTSYFSAGYDEEYGYTEYYLEDDSVKKSVFEDSCEGIPLFSEGNYDASQYKVTYVQRKKGSESDMKSIPSATEKVIQKLNSGYSANS